MTPEQLEIVRELRAMGAVRVRMGDTVITFGAPVMLPERAPRAEPVTEDTYIRDAMKGLS